MGLSEPVRPLLLRTPSLSRKRKCPNLVTQLGRQGYQESHSGGSHFLPVHQARGSLWGEERAALLQRQPRARVSLSLLRAAGRLWAGPNLFKPHFLVVEMGIAILQATRYGRVGCLLCKVVQRRGPTGTPVPNRTLVPYGPVAALTLQSCWGNHLKKPRREGTLFIHRDMQILESTADPGKSVSPPLRGPLCAAPGSPLPLARAHRHSEQRARLLLCRWIPGHEG